MFPQSELDNYKLQVELLQEKLQRSEISRQQLEHKLDKILQKRDEHERLVRSTARQKYQQFLEEQQRRNERNKQLVQMLERIEQQTEIMNARSERLKMMKLQYEMYFAKLVHTQTRRCIQNSVQPVTHFMPTSSNQPVWSAVQQSPMEAHNYVPNAETPTPLGTNNSYQGFTTSQEETMPIPTLTNFIRNEQGNHFIPPNNITAAPSIPPAQQLYQHNTKTETNRNMADIPANLAFNNNQEIPNSKIVYGKINGNMTISSAASLLSNDKKLPDSKEHSNLSTVASSIFEEPPNLAMMPQQSDVHNLNELPKPSRILNSNHDVVVNDYNSKFDTVVQPLNNSPQIVNKTPMKSTNEKLNIEGSLEKDKDVNKFNTKSQDAGNELQATKTLELKKTDDIKMPNRNREPSTSLQLETPNSVTATFSTSTKNKNYLQKQSVSIDPTESEYLTNNTETTNSSATPVSIETIENEIYGELLSPLEREEIRSPETSNVIPKLLGNLVTQSETIENISSAESQVKQEASSVKPNEDYNTEATVNDNEQNQKLYSYEQNAANVQQPEKSADYTNYENVENADIDESQQQYDYSNYDPTQYSYPGYVYDETTGEYKPDPNAPLQQYATDQQYASEGYEQQYQQQDYDYNQSYTEEATGLPTNVEHTISNDYDTITTQQEELANGTTTVRDVTQQQTMEQPEPIPPQTNIAPEEVSTAANAKIVKPASILSSADKSESQKKKKRVNFIDSSETDESAEAAVDKAAASSSKPVSGNLVTSGESDFDFSSSTEAEAKTT